MKKGIYLAALLSFVSLTSTLKAQSSSDRNNALGIRISSQDAVINHSISYKRFFSSTTAVEALFSFSDPVALGLLLEKHKPFGTSGFSFFYGGGAYAGFGGGRKFGAQGIFGLDLVAPTLPLNLSIDWKPELNFVGQFSFEPAAVGFTARFVF